MRKYIHALYNLIEPDDLIKDETMRRQARLLSGLLLIFIPLSATIVLYRWSLSGSPITLMMGALVMLGFALTFFISRTRYFQSAGVIAVFIISVICTISIILNLTVEVPLIYFSFSSMVAIVVLSARYAFIASIANIILAVLVSQIVNYIDPMLIRRDLTFMVILTLIVWLIVMLRRYDLNELTQKNDRMLMLKEQQLQLKLEYEKSRLLANFVQDVSHDLKTPLSVIKTSSYLLQKQTPLEYHQRIALINQQADYIKQVIDNFLSMSQLDEIADLTMIPIDVHLLVNDICQMMMIQAEEKNQSLHILLTAPHMMVAGNDIELRRCLTNLIQNAIHYTPDDGHIHVKTTSDDEHLMLMVKDNGRGISEEALPHIFDRFYRAEGDDAIKNRRGTGLGLAIVKRVIDLHNGTIDVTSQPGAGTCFYIQLPLVISSIQIT